MGRKNLLQNTTQLAQAIWAHYLSPQLASGAYAAVDATCGRGNDTVWLAARCGRVYAFDIQPDAIASTREALQAAGIADAQILASAGITACCRRSRCAGITTNTGTGQSTQGL